MLHKPGNDAEPLTVPVVQPGSIAQALPQLEGHYVESGTISCLTDLILHLLMAGVFLSAKRKSECPCRSGAIYRATFSRALLKMRNKLRRYGMYLQAKKSRASPACTKIQP